jgi:branched-chain amino acid transport system permease protein
VTTSARTLPLWLLPLAAGAVIIAAPALGLSADNQRQVILITILALTVSGLNLSFGFAGELALGQVAVYATGAYLSGYLGSHGHTDIVLQLAAAAAAAVVVGIVTGIPGLRLGSWSLAMTSFFLVLLVPDVLNMLQGSTGGSLGLTGIANATFAGSVLTSRAYYVVVTITGVAWLIVLRNLVTSRHGTAFRVLRQSPVLAASTGISVYRMKLTAYALGSIPAGLAGCLFANLDHYLSPTTFGFDLAISILAASILGGSLSVYGAVVGATIMQLGPLESTSFQQYALVVYGGFLIVGGVLLSGGIAGLLNAGWRRWVKRPDAPAPDAPSEQGLGAIPGAALAVRGVSKRFGGMQALRDVDLTAPAGKITALIGPNGSGKTTLLNVISGFYRRDSGTITLGDADAEPSAPHQIARSGVARTFQTPSIPKGISVLEAVRAGRYALDRSSMAAAILRLPSYRRVRQADTAEAERVLALMGLLPLASEEAVALPLGTRRLLEVARALISRPRVLLLDEAASGLDEGEVERLGALIRAIRDAGATVVLVEHNFRLVLSLADEVYVLAQGEIIAHGPPEEIERHPRVLREYLGVEAGDAAVLGRLEDGS